MMRNIGEKTAQEDFDRSFEELGLDHIDLVLVHMPLGDVFGTWRVLEQELERGRVRAIGVSDFTPARLQDLISNSAIPPLLDQFQSNPYCASDEVLSFCQKQGIAFQAWSPLVHGDDGLFADLVLESIAASHGKSIAQVALLWQLQRGASYVAESTHPERMRENLDLFGFSLSDDEMKKISSLARHQTRSFFEEPAFIAHLSKEWHEDRGRGTCHLPQQEPVGIIWPLSRALFHVPESPQRLRSVSVEQLWSKPSSLHHIPHGGICSGGSILEVQDLRKTYRTKNGSTEAVRGISFSVPRGEVYGFLGPNGAGKSTTISMLTTQLAPASGDILLDGHSVTKDPVHARGEIGVVAQHNNLDRGLTARENLIFHARYFGMSRRDANQKADEYLENFGLADRQNDYVRSYSGDMAQRLKIARAMMHTPKILFLDEPTTSLGPNYREILWREMLALNKEAGTTTVSVTGATFSSNSILEAVADATGLEFANPNSTISSGHGRGQRA